MNQMEDQQESNMTSNESFTGLPASESATAPAHYLEIIRRNYHVLIHLGYLLQDSHPEVVEDDLVASVANTIGMFVERLVWADGQVVLGEFTALNALIAEDSQHGGHLEKALRDAQMSASLSAPVADELPKFLQECVAYDRVNRRRLSGMAINSLESLGLALLACDRSIDASEMESLHSTVSAWRRALERANEQLTSAS